MTIWRMRIACCMTKATNTHPEYVTVIAFTQQQWLHERDSLLRHTYSTLPVFLSLGMSEVFFFATEVSGVQNFHHQYKLNLDDS